MEQMKKQAEIYGTRILIDYVKNVDFSEKVHKVITEKEEFESFSTIIATGAKAKWLNIEGEEQFRGFGVSACATCDGFFKDKVGGCSWRW